MQALKSSTHIKHVDQEQRYSAHNDLVRWIDVLCNLIRRQNVVDKAVDVAATHHFEQFEKCWAQSPFMPIVVCAIRTKVFFDADVLGQLLQEIDWSVCIKHILWHLTAHIENKLLSS